MDIFLNGSRCIVKKKIFSRFSDIGMIYADFIIKQPIWQ